MLGILGVDGEDALVGAVIVAGAELLAESLFKGIGKSRAVRSDEAIESGSLT